MPRGWALAFALVALAAAPTVAGFARLHELARGVSVTQENARFFVAPVPVAAHVVAASVYGSLGAFQFVPGLGRGRSSWHRRAGRLLAGCGVVVALSGLWMALFFPRPEGDGVALTGLRLLFGSAMLGCIVLAVLAILRGNVATHAAQMTRAYAIGMGAGTQVLTHLPYFALFGKPDEFARTVLMGSAWVLNLAVAEWAVRRRPWAARRVTA
jgi:hypothetical protein